MAKFCTICGEKTSSPYNKVCSSLLCVFMQRKARGHPNLTPLYLSELWGVQNGKCAICGDEMVPAVGARRTNIGSLDRILPGVQGGKYETGNVRWSCDYCNFYRSDLNDTALLVWAQKILRTLKCP